MLWSPGVPGISVPHQRHQPTDTGRDSDEEGGHAEQAEDDNEVHRLNSTVQVSERQAEERCDEASTNHRQTPGQSSQANASNIETLRCTCTCLQTKYLSSNQAITMRLKFNFKVCCIYMIMLH